MTFYDTPLSVDYKKGLKSKKGGNFEKVFAEKIS